MQAKLGILFGICLLMIIPFVNAQDAQIVTTDKGSLKVSLRTEPANPLPGEKSQLKIDFLNPKSDRIQEHIDWWITISKEGENTFGPIKRSHTSSGSVTVPVVFPEEGTYRLLVELDGILFRIIPIESATFDLSLGTESQNGEQETEIPDWIKNNAGWWAQGLIGDSDFVQGIQYLIQNEIMKIPPTAQGSGNGSSEIPDWIKNNAGWWAEGLITDKDFVQGIQYLIENGIMKIG